MLQRPRVWPTSACGVGADSGNLPAADPGGGGLRAPTWSRYCQYYCSDFTDVETEAQLQHKEQGAGTRTQTRSTPPFFPLLPCPSQRLKTLLVVELYS